MRISWRPSGSEGTPGRGEYEISENFGRITPTDLLRRRIILDLGDGISVNTNLQLTDQGGKRRLRRIGESGIQIQRQFAAVMLMPKPGRDERVWESGAPVMTTGKYGLVHIDLSAVELIGSNAVRLVVEEAQLRNHSYHAELLHHQTRFRQIRTVWQQRELFPEPIAELIEAHESSVRSSNAIGQQTENTVIRLQRTMAEMSDDLAITGTAPSTDVLPALLEFLGAASTADEEPIDVDQIPREEIEILRRELKRRRRAAAYRPGAARFRKSVREAYRATCLVCGLRLPRLGRDSKSGVDAAHILPWAEFDLDTVANGLCLCKLHHWAFDEGLIEILFNDHGYTVVVPASAEARVEASDADFDLQFLRDAAGLIPTDRLPVRPAHRPSPQLLQRLRELQADD